MALKDFDSANPRTKDKNWKEGIPLAELPKTDEWYAYRIVGGVFSYAQHWIEFTNKTGEKKRYPIDCANWDPEAEANTKKGRCPACEAGLRPGVRYMMNVIDRNAQNKGDPDPIRCLDIPPTVTKQLQDLKKLNLVKGEAKGINHPKFGTDVHLQKQKSKKRGGVEWQAQKGERTALSAEEEAYELIAFDEHWMEPDVDKIREDLKRHGFFEEEEKSDSRMPPKGKKSSDDEDDVVPPKKRKPPVDEDEFEAPRKAKKPPVDDDEEEDAVPSRSPSKAKKPVEDEEEEVVPPRKAKKPPVDEDEDEDAVPPRRAKPATVATAPAKKPKPPVDDDEEEDAPPPKKVASKKPPVEDFEDDFEDV